MSNLPYLRPLVFDSTTDIPEPGAKLYFYEAGSVTPLDTYSDSALSSANANPVVADGEGIFGPIYLQAQEYKVKLTNSSDVTLWEQDNVYGLEELGSSLESYFNQAVSHPLRFGALGDGVADESNEVQQAIDAANRTVDLLGKYYRCDSQLVLDTGIKLTNGFLDFSNCTDAECIKLQGSLQSAVLLSSDASEGDTSIVVASASGIARGDWLLLSSNAAWNGSYTNGQLVQVAGVSGTTLTLMRPVEADYTTANGASVREVSYKQLVSLQDLILICDPTNSQSAILTEYCSSLYIRDVEIRGCPSEGFNVKTSSNVRLESLIIGQDAANTAKAILVENACDGVMIDGCELAGCAEGVTISADAFGGGVSRRVTVRDCRISARTYGVNAERNSQHLTIRGCHFSAEDGSADGIRLNGVADALVDGCKVDALTGTSIDCQNAETPATAHLGPIIIRGCTLEASTVAGVDYTGTDGAQQLMVIGNHMVGSTYGVRALSVDGRVDIKSNTIKVTDDDDGIRVTCTQTDDETVSIEGNSIECTAAGSVGIYLSDGNAHISSNVVDIGDGDGRGIDVDGQSNGHNVSVLNNTVEGNTSAPAIYVADALISVQGNFASGGIYVSPEANSSKCVISGNSGFSGGGSAIEAVGQSGCKGLAVTGNAYNMTSGATFNVLEISGIWEGITVSGNMLRRGNDSDACVSLAGTAPGDIDHVTIDGNILSNGTYGIEVSNITNGKHSDNCFIGMLSGDTSGSNLTTDALSTAVLAVSNFRVDIEGDGGTEDLQGVAAGNNRWVYVGGQTPTVDTILKSDAYSPAIVTAITAAGGYTRPFYGACHDSSDSVFVVCGELEEIQSIDNTTGTTATSRNSGGSSLMRDIISDDSGLYVCVGGGGTILRSTNLTAWTGETADAGFASIFYGVAYGASIFVAVGASGEIQSSPDGQTWTQRKTGGDTLRSVRFANSLFVAVGDNGDVWTSTDGTSWTDRTISGASDLYAVSYSTENSLWVAVGDEGYVSTNGVNWTQFAIPANDGGAVPINAIAHGANGVGAICGDENFRGHSLTTFDV